MSRLICITGGIGSGKSVVAQLIRIMGYHVYDCDARAKWLMEHDRQLRSDLVRLFGPETYLSHPDLHEVRLNRPYLSSHIFANADALNQMNAAVHPAVARDLRQQQLSSGDDTFFFESAILYESNFDRLVHPDQVWTVSAPLEMRIFRAMQRDNTTREKVLNRIMSQLPQDEKERRASHVIVNDDRHSLIRQVTTLLSFQNHP